MRCNDPGGTPTDGGFEQEAEYLLTHIDEYRRQERRVGIEYELLVVDKDLQPYPTAVSSFLARDHEGYDTEQHTDTIEVRTEPYPVDAFDSMVGQLYDRVGGFLSAEPEAAVLGLGAHPVKLYDDIEITSSGRYGRVIDELAGYRTELEGLTAGIHVNLQARDEVELVDDLNHAVMLSPYVVAVAANSSLLMGGDTGAVEARLPLIENCLGLPERTGMPRYYRDLADYLDEREQWDDVAGVSGLDGRLSTDWHEVRIRVGPDRTLRTEFRAIPQQPTIDESLACVALYLGLIEHYRGTALLDHGLVELNREEAMHHGLSGELYDPEGRLRPAWEVVHDELEKAAEGLDVLGIDPDYLAPLYDRVRRRSSPGEDVAQDARVLAGLLDVRTARITSARRRLQGADGRLMAYASGP